MSYGPQHGSYPPPPHPSQAYGQHARQPLPYSGPAGYGYPPGYPNPYAASPTHSGLGIASFILGLLAGLGMVALIMVAAVLSAEAPGGELDENSPEAVAVGCSLIVAAGMALLGLILGIVGAVQGGKKKVFPVLGIVFNGGLILVVAALMILGAAMG